MKSFRLLLPVICTRTAVDFRISRCCSSIKKDTSHPIASAYNPKDVESGWYEWWEGNGFFRRSDAQEKFVMILPPPNITGHLHLGHALTCAIQDVLARWHQMNGRRVVWVPGCDHAGIATQVVVERHLWATKQVTRHQLGRERFVDEILEWKEQKGTKIYDQMKRLGVSLDWDRAVYTMDESMSRSVSEAFIKLFNAGLIYRKMSLVNWCCKLQSAISNIEVEHLELDGPTPLRVPGYEQPVTFGKMYDFAYEICGSDEVIVVSTTRPETMLGDTAVMVNPADSRYAHLVGKKAHHPFRKEEIKIIADEHVNPDFGTGAVKVTPAHSAHDFEVGTRHDLPQITIFDEQGKINLSEFKGQPRFAARDSVLSALSRLGLYRGSRPHPMVIPVCSRTNDIIEPLLKPQWYVNVTEMARGAAAAVESGDLQIYPENYKAVWREWLVKNIQDWCISRQLWWGHRIPAFRVECDGAGKESWVAAASEEEAKKVFLEKSGLPETKIRKINQDDDVLDTWFSSGLLPFAAFGWPRNTQDYDHLYPTSLLETGHDILFFWVGRMVMLGLQLTGRLPFKKVVLHGLIHDAKGQKMSKSKGNVIDPMDVINGASLELLQGHVAEGESQGVLTRQGAEEAHKHQVATYPKGIPECGADALRFSLCSYSLENEFVAVDVNRMEHHKFLGNKIWQVMRFLLSASDNAPKECCARVTYSQIDNLQVMDRWILSQLSQLVSSAQRNIPTFNLYRVVAQFEIFWYKCLCDVYLESIKPVLKSGEAGPRNASFQVLWTCVDVCLHVSSPFMPFLTEELYQRLPRHLGKEDSILQCRYPREDEWDCWQNVHLEAQVKVLLEVVSSLRSMKSAYGVESRRLNQIHGSLITEDQALASFLEDSVSVIETLAHVSSFAIIEGPERPPTASAVATISDKTSVYLHLKGLIDPAVELQRLEKKILKLKKTESELLKRMSHKRYKLKTPLAVQESLEVKLATLRKEMEQVESLVKTVEEL